ncbi:hypothetical protein UFOVP116_71 [uncultured Caudovirales phage]|uniref:DUF7487 domain-containing protein n=1 Tax=uncultured Caudovirales phage TaxID=2100421 RepID=A0A6J5L6H8_9CAUD|nr:hypothetical protein UFOVP116_71 [uncultured Caudovirales phage]
MQAIGEFIVANCLTTSGKIKACIYKATWWSAHGFERQRTEISNCTSFLPPDATYLQRFYHILNNISSIPLCPQCNMQTHWYGSGNRYNTYCSKKCGATASLDKRIEQSLQNYGVPNPSQSTAVKEAIKQTNLKKYGVDNFAKSEEFKNVRNRQIAELTAEQITKTNAKRSETCMQRFGAPSTVASTLIQEKITATMIDRYGVAKPLQSEQIRTKQQQTTKARYGRDFWTQQHIDSATLENLKCKEWVEQQLTVKSINQLANAIGMSFSNLCKIINKHDLMPANYSSFHTEVLNFITVELGITNVICNDRNTLGGLEIDILLPDLKIGFECNGVYWHSEIAGRKEPNYHLTKTRAANAVGVQLVHIFDSEWFGAKRPQIECKIRNILHKTSKKVGGRQCKIIDATTLQERAFIGENHLQGYVASSHCIGLEYAGELVAAMSFSKPRYTTKHQWELLRYCTKSNIVVQGGFSKLFRYFVDKYAISEIISYCDRRWSVGNVYGVNGFELVGESPPAYYYHSDGKTLNNRVKFQKHKLSNLLEQFNPTLTEWQNMQNAGYDRIWDCGNLTYVWKRNK